MTTQKPKRMCGEVFPEHINHDYFHSGDDEPIAPHHESASTGVTEHKVENHRAVSKKNEGIENDMAIGSWAMARGRRY